MVLSSVSKESIKDEKGNIKLASKTFGVTLALIKAGESVDEATKRKFSWNDSVKIIVGDKSIKLTAMQAAFLLKAFTNPEVAAELKARKEVERAVMLAEAEAVN